MVEKFIKNFQGNFKSAKFITSWYREIKNFCSSTKVNDRIYENDEEKTQSRRIRAEQNKKIQRVCL